LQLNQVATPDLPLSCSLSLRTEAGKNLPVTTRFLPILDTWSTKRNSALKKNLSISGTQIS
jgi:hypothetical protein